MALFFSMGIPISGPLAREIHYPFQRAGGVQTLLQIIFILSTKGVLKTQSGYFLMWSDYLVINDLLTGVNRFSKGPGHLMSGWPLCKVSLKSGKSCNKGLRLRVRIMMDSHSHTWRIPLIFSHIFCESHSSKRAVPCSACQIMWNLFPRPYMVFTFFTTFRLNCLDEVLLKRL